VPNEQAGEHERQLALHALVIKGFASTDALATVTGLAPDRVNAVLQQLSTEGLAKLREGRLSGWAPTPQAKELHQEMLQGPLAARDPDLLRVAYEEFSQLNGTFKELCTRWQLKGSDSPSPVPNDHSDAAYDLAAIEDLALLDSKAADLLERMSASLGRVERYRQRLGEALQALKQGDRDKFTKPLYDSYHDIWMELHQDLIVTLGLQRTAADA
jgi:hypothetical protein